MLTYQTISHTNMYANVFQQIDVQIQDHLCSPNSCKQNECSNLVILSTGAKRDY